MPPRTKPLALAPTDTAQAILPKLRALASRRPEGAGPPVNAIRFVLLSWTQYGAPWITPEQERWLRAKLASSGRWIPTGHERDRLGPALMRWAQHVEIVGMLQQVWPQHSLEVL